MEVIYVGRGGEEKERMKRQAKISERGQGCVGKKGGDEGKRRLGCL